VNDTKVAKGNLLQRIFSVMFLLPAWFAPHKSLRVFFHRLRGVKIGKNVEIGYSCLLDNVHPNLITIEDGAVVTAGTVILAHDNAFFYTGRGPVKYGPVVIKKNAFIGINSLIMPNVIVGEKAIVGANSVVVRDVAANSIVAGSPARVIREG
jgi:acetyltransferase-like isoleucine patch superfamily enzyme